MRKVLWTALACLAAAVLALLAVRLGVQAAVPAYPASLGDDPIPEKITGETLIRAAAAQDNTLTVFGSSELKTTDICTHPANFFAGARCGFQVNLVGRGSCQSLVHAMAIAASGESLRGKKVVLITAPQSYTAEGIAPDLFMANFSEQQMLTLLQDKTLPAESRRYLAARVQALTEVYNAENGTELQAHTAAGLLTRAAAADRSAACALLTPYAALSRWLLDTKDLVTASAAMRAAPEAKEPALSADIDWQQEEEAALAQAHTLVTGNDFYMLDSYYATYVGHKLAQMAGKDSALRYDESPEYDDLRCLLDICAAKELDVLFVHVPLNGSWSDYTGFTADRREAYYEKVRQIAGQYGNVTLLDLTQEEYTPYFLCDTMHLGWRGWLAVDRAMAAFWNEDQG